MRKGQNVLLILACLGMLAGTAQAGNMIGVGQLTLEPTGKCMGVRLAFSGDDNDNATATMYYTVQGEDEVQGHEMVRLDGYRGEDPVLDPIDEFVSSIFVLPSDTNVYVRIVVSDPDGVGIPPGLYPDGKIDGDEDTLNLTREAPSGTVYYVDGDDGDDETGDGSSEHPFKTVQKAIGTGFSLNKAIYVRPRDGNEPYRDCDSTQWFAFRVRKANNVWIGKDPATQGEVIFDGSFTDDDWDGDWYEVTGYTDIYAREVDDGDMFTTTKVPGFAGWDPDTGGDMIRCFFYPTLSDLASASYLPGYTFVDGDPDKVYVHLGEEVSPSDGLVVVSKVHHGIVVEKYSLYACRNVVLDQLTLRYYGHNEYVQHGPEDWRWHRRGKGVYVNNALLCTVQDCTVKFAPDGIFVGYDTPTFARHLIRDNTVYDTLGLAAHGAVCPGDTLEHARRGTGIWVNGNTKGCMIYDNTVQGVFDGISTSAANDTDVIGNEVDSCHDDAIALDDGNDSGATHAAHNAGVNQRCIGNIIGTSGGVTAGVSATGIDYGPTFIIRNKIYQGLRGLAYWVYDHGEDTTDKSMAFKLSMAKDSYGWTMIYHNSVKSRDVANVNDYLVGIEFCNDGYEQYRCVVMNNILQTAGYTLHTYNELGESEIDYDCHWLVDEWEWPYSHLIYWVDTWYSCLLFGHFYNDTGYEEHGFCDDPEWASTDTDDFTLDGASPCIDAGTIIYGVNDQDYSGEDPDMGAEEYEE